MLSLSIKTKWKLSLLLVQQYWIPERKQLSSWESYNVWPEMPGGMIRSGVVCVVAWWGFFCCFFRGLFWFVLFLRNLSGTISMNVYLSIMIWCYFGFRLCLLVLVFSFCGLYLLCLLSNSTSKRHEKWWPLSGISLHRPELIPVFKSCQTSKCCRMLKKIVLTAESCSLSCDLHQIAHSYTQLLYISYSLCLGLLSIDFNILETKGYM